MFDPDELAHFEIERSRLLNQLFSIGDFRRGTLRANYRRCGKPNCVCTKPDHPGHGPQYLLTKTVAGKSLSRNIRPGPELELVQEQVGNYQRFQELEGKLIEINEQISDARLLTNEADAGTTAKKGAPKPNSSPKQPPKSPPS